MKWLEEELKFKKWVKKELKQLVEYDILQDKFFLDAACDNQKRIEDCYESFGAKPIYNIAVTAAKMTNQDVSKRHVFNAIIEAIGHMQRHPYSDHFKASKIARKIALKANEMFMFKLEYPGFESNDLLEEEI